MKSLGKKKTRQVDIRFILRTVSAIILCAVITLTIFIGKRPYRGNLHEGDISLRSIYSPIDYLYNIGVDEDKLAQLRQKAMAEVYDLYDLDAAKMKGVLSDCDIFFSNILEMKKGAPAPPLAEDWVDANVKIFLQMDGIEGLAAKIKEIIGSLESRGLLDDADKKELLKAKVEKVIVRDSLAATEELRDTGGLPTLKEAKKQGLDLVSALVSTDRRTRLAVDALLENLLKPSLIFNLEETRLRREARANSVPIQYKQEEVKKGELIVAKGQRVTKNHLAKLQALDKRQVKANQLFSFLGIALLVVGSVIVAAIYLKLYRPKVFASNQNLVLISLLALLTVIIAKGIVVSPLSNYLIPASIASMLMAMLIGSQVAMMMTVMVSLLAGFTAGYSLNIMIVSLIGGIVGVYAVLGLRRRSQLLRAGLLVGVANFVCIIGIGFLYNLEYTIVIREALWGVANGIFSAMIVTGILPVFEYLFKITTNISLLELLDLNHPILRELVVRAPGTYHHSLIVGNLAEAACERIGANALLARVGAYYHDIGKIGKAEYFSENQKDARSRHDKLTPSMSSLIITNHIKDGIDLAHKYKLNQAILNFIEQHHGTSLIYYFYQRALEKVEDLERLREEGFRYPGPKPQTKETAIVLLSDSVEAASRTLSDPTPARIKGLVRKIINNKFIDGQLDECELTLKDLEKIADTFVHVLTGVHHTRVEYPEEGEGENRKGAKKDNNKPGSSSPNSSNGPV